MKYPEITNKNFYNDIYEDYKKFHIPKKKRTFNEICFPDKYELQPSQKFLPEFINPKTPYKSILIYHKIGSGKTCTAIRVAEEWKKIRNIFVVLPASLKNSFRGELRSKCANDDYLKESERNKLRKLHPTSPEYEKIIRESDDRINKYYNIFSYNKFIQQVKINKINLKNSILIIDEIQNMVSIKGSYYNILYELIKKAPSDLRIVLLSATPMFDRPNEIALTMNLLKLQQELPIGSAFNKEFINIIRKDDKIIYKAKNLMKFKKMIKGHVSYFRGAPDYVFPEMKIKFVRCVMSNFQYSAYKTVSCEKFEDDEEKTQCQDNGPEYERNIDLLTIDDLPHNFFLGSRIISNIVFPNKKINEEGFESFKGTKITDDLEKYSTKFNKIIKKIEKGQGKMFFYSGFKKYGGIKSFAQVLEAFGYKNYIDHGEGKRRYAIWSGDQDMMTKRELESVFNNKRNLDGSRVKILLLSPSAKEGLSLYGIRQAHILENYWNWSRMLQIIGRGSRYCSHKDLPEEERNIKVYIYLSVHPKEKETIDEYIYELSKTKNKLIEQFEQAIKEAAVDCELFKNANTSNDNDIICEK